ncbi:MAG: beta propeller repeat protein [Thermoplasmatota archaeon]
MRMGPLGATALAAIALAATFAGCVSPVKTASTSSANGLPNPLSSLPAAFGAVVKVGSSGNEPVVRVAPDGTIFIAALNHVYVSKDKGASFHEVNFNGQIPIYASDSALSISPSGTAYVVFDWPYAGETAVCQSADDGATWTCDPVVVPGATDRMWIVAPTKQDVYVITGETLDRPTFVVSHDAGKTWKITYFDPMTEVQGADLAFDATRNLVVEGASDPNGTGWGIREWNPNGTYLGFKKQTIASPEPTVAIDSAGTWWAVACTSTSSPCLPAVAMSDDAGKTWTLTALPFEGKTFMLPFIAASWADHVALAWYETNATSASDPSAAWRVVTVQTVNGAQWTRAVLTPAPVHTGAMCASVSCIGEARFAGDFLGLAYDANASLYATWMHQTGTHLPPTTQLQAMPWDDVEFARTGGPAPAPANATRMESVPSIAPIANLGQ